MITKLKKITILGVAVFSVVALTIGLSLLIPDNSLEEIKKKPKIIDEKQVDPEITGIDPISQKQEFTVNLDGGMKHGDVLTISGSVPTSESSITGMIYHGKQTDSTGTIVNVFQLTSDKYGFYTHNVVVNDNYLWKQGVEYTISIENDGIYKELKFHRNW